MLSIIIPAYNAEKYISETINSIFSVLHESNLVFEVIVVNDGSTDNTEFFVNSLINENSINLKIYSINNSGVSAARNYGISMSRFEFLYFIDADDLLNSDFKKMAELLSFDIDILEGKLVVFAENTSDNTVEKILRKPSVYNSFDLSEIFCSKTWLLSARIFNKRAIGSVRFNTKIRFCEDMEFLIQVYKNSSKIINVDSTLYYYRTHGGSVTSTYRPYFYTDLLLIYDNVSYLLNESEKYLLAQHIFQLVKRFSRVISIRGFKESHVATDLIFISQKKLSCVNFLSLKLIISNFNLYALTINCFASLYRKIKCIIR